MFRSIFFVATLAVLCVTFASVDGNSQLMKKLVKEYTDNTKNRLPKSGACSTSNLVVREEWYAVPCLYHTYSRFISWEMIKPLMCFSGLQGRSEQPDTFGIHQSG